MELIGSLFLVLALAVVVALYIGRPFLFKTNQTAADGPVTAEQEREHRTSALLAERDRVLNSLQELDFDYSLGKVPPEEYPQQRAVLLKTGADVLRQLDELEASTAGAGKNARPMKSSEVVEDRIEAAVAARRADAAQRKGPPADGQPAAEPAAARTNGKGKDDVEEIIATRKRERKESAAGFCPRCGKPVQKSDKFCSRCGTTL